MMEHLAERISRYLVKVGIAVEEDREVIAFGWFRILSNILQYGILLVSSAAFGLMPEIMAYTLMFASLKRYAGGAHARSYKVCLAVTTALPYAAYCLCRAVPLSVTLFTAMVASLVTLGLVLLRAPVAHPNNPKSPKRIKKLRRVSVRIAVAQAVSVAVCGFIAPDWTRLCILCGAAGGLSAGISLLIPMPAKGGE